MVEADWCVGEVIAHLKEKGLLENTLVIFTSDNGPVVNDGYYDDAEERLGDHDPRGGTRGGKYSLYDGGAHIPLIVCWKGHVEAKVSPALVSQLDFFASLGKLVGGEVPEEIDSREYLDALLGRTDSARKDMVLEAQGKLAYRSGQYALIPAYKGPERNTTKNELGNLPEWSLFDLKADRGQLHNIAAQHPEEVQTLKNAFLAIVGDHYKPAMKEAELK